MGPIVNFTAALIILSLRRHRAVACVSGSVSVGVPIGLYLYTLYTQGNPIVQQQAPNFFGFQLPLWSAFVLSLTISSLITIAFIGYILLGALAQQRVIEPLKSRGLKIMTEK